jgi:PIN domain nuclease of toxin-antitoxin system
MILLDTHALIWWAVESPKLSRRAQRALNKETVRGISDITCWEIAMLQSHGRAKFDRDVLEWLDGVILEFNVEVIPISPKIAVRSQRLGAQFHGDPADRLITATAVELAAPLVTRDSNIQSFSGVTTIW